MMETILDFLKKCEIFYVATTDGIRPHLRPFGAVVRWNDQLLIQTGSQKAVAQQLRMDPHVEIVACDGENWMRIAAVVQEIHDPAAEERIYAEYPYLRESHTEAAPMMVLSLAHGTATYFPAEGAVETISL